MLHVNTCNLLKLEAKLAMQEMQLEMESRAKRRTEFERSQTEAKLELQRLQLELATTKIRASAQKPRTC